MLSEGNRLAFTSCGPYSELSPAYPSPSLLDLQGPSLCFAGACPRDGSVEATHPTPALSSPCLEPPVPSWARWPRATLPSKWREQGRVAHRVGGEEGSLGPGWAVSEKRFAATRNGWGVGSGVPASQTLPGMAYLLLSC